MSVPSSLDLVREVNLELSEKQARQLACLLDVLEGDEHAPTAVHERARAAKAHIADSLVGLEVEAVAKAETIADVGSGAGFPGLPLAVALPGADVRLVESQRRACEFIERTCTAAGVANAHAVRARAEGWREGVRAHDAVLARALAPQPVVLEYAAPLLRPGGALVDWRGRRSREEEEAARAAAAQLGLELREIRRVTPFGGARERHLHVFAKVAETPARFPRRAGVARKRPIASVASDRGRG
ncbi:MAG TPA: 16S rRNA (guanine(527)-N(7))-methyltransferase RsmG [Solirubrobacteraceae bacterium]|nr:16S rRNA (guanine(527)-N(7))-methyltransferase RsmG [Solirubrobacteraceae bacterium]